MRSISSFISGLQVGGKTLIFFPLIFKVHPKEERIFLISAVDIENPMILKS